VGYFNFPSKSFQESRKIQGNQRVMVGLEECGGGSENPYNPIYYEAVTFP